MSNKKRNKKYRGREAAQGPVVKKFEVDGTFNRKEWFDENKLILATWGMRFIVFGVAASLGWFIFSLIR